MLKPEKIKFVGFDLDQTLYPDTPESKKEYRNTIYVLLAKELKISKATAEKEFEKNYKVLGSGTEAVRVLGVKNPEQFSALVSRTAKIHHYLARDQRLVDMIEALKEKYVLFLVSASAKESADLKLNKLGISLKDFKYAVFNDEKGSGKTTGKSFRQLMKLTKAKPQEHVFVGDRDVTDIVPPKKLGMQTIMVWGILKRRI